MSTQSTLIDYEQAGVNVKLSRAVTRNILAYWECNVRRFTEHLVANMIFDLMLISRIVIGDICCPVLFSLRSKN